VFEFRADGPFGEGLRKTVERVREMIRNKITANSRFAAPISVDQR